MKIIKVKKADTAAYQDFAKQCQDVVTKINGLTSQRSSDIGK